jgi:phosphopantetheinyl transferase
MTTITLSADIEAPWFVEQYPYWLTQLNEQESQRYVLMKSKRKQQQMLLSRALIAKALAQFNRTLNSTYKILNYSTLVFPDSAQTYALSITHSGAMAAIVLSDQPLKVGIDIEQIKKRNFAELAKEICTKTELALIKDRQNIEADFYQLWTIKESLAKASHSPLTDLYQCDCSAVLLHDRSSIYWHSVKYKVNCLNIQSYKGSVVMNSEEIILLKQLNLAN